MLAICDEFGLASIDRGPLSRGALTGKYTADAGFPQDDLRSRDSVRRDWLVRNVEKLAAIREVLTRDGRTPAQGALAWILARHGRTIPIPGIRNAAQAEENAAAMRFGPLRGDRMGEIERLLGRS